MFVNPAGRPRPGETQLFNLEVKRQIYDHAKETANQLRAMYDRMGFESRSEQKTQSAQSTESVTHQPSPNLPSLDMTVEPIRRSISVAPAGTGLLNMDGSMISVRNKYLADALKDPDLRAQLPVGSDSAYEALTKGHSILVDWEESSQDTTMAPPRTNWVRIVSRIKQEDLIYFVKECGHLSSRSKPASGKEEPYTITREASLYHEQRKQIRYAFATTGWPCRIADGKVCLAVCGRTLTLVQEHISPQPFDDGINARVKLHPIASRLFTAKYQPMACSPEASFVLNRYELHVEARNQKRRIYNPCAAQVNQEWEKLFKIIAEAVTVDSTDKDRLLYCHQYVSKPAGDLTAGIAARLRDGGARLPLENCGGGWSEFVLPGYSEEYLRYPQLGGHNGKAAGAGSSRNESGSAGRGRLKVDPLPDGGPQEIILLVTDRNEANWRDGLMYGVWPKGKAGFVTGQLGRGGLP
ncbi:hypothetical protein BDZ90DRAFT_275711 [Jaminaea rosea]|uniref:Uncharacterized protein n=1 Tax=Jaminaea rosea TaxID=1569628 RepID=A0A316UNB8_9BASI|nr:hypothetical protein BDZ90DRAFT_275711 [Jaminaea rosea]PWN25841.1 hypothetical protein BDZ90DRAFT_275711 [Jaminaea rosea]